MSLEGIGHYFNYLTNQKMNSYGERFNRRWKEDLRELNGGVGEGYRI
ncbi:MAG: hypothetical protein N2327_06630 [Caldimicrobium sp.]|nr:hypothetical protein [Caldimicrobium sp.]MDW8093777.1 hypothetical protein [Caldimicrobium sp.]